MEQVHRLLLLLLCGLALSACRESGNTTSAQKPLLATKGPAAAAKEATSPGRDAPRAPATPPELPKDSGPELPALPALAAMKFQVIRETLWVTSAFGNVSLLERASRITDTKVDKNIITLNYVDEVSCALDKREKFSEGQLQARIENSRAFRLYKSGDFSAAARGFRRAAQLDSEYALARTNHIAALARVPDPATAAIAFKLALARDPVRSYEKLLSDDDYKPLQAEFRVQANAETEPLISLKGRALNAFLVAHSAEQEQVAVVRTQASWGSENWMAELHIFDARTGKLISLHPLVEWQDTLEEGGINPARRKDTLSRLAHMSETLAALHFEAAPPDSKSEFQLVDSERKVHEAKLLEQNASLIARENTLRLVRGDQVLDSFTTTLRGAEPKQAVALPAAHAVVFFGHYMVAEGCDSGPEARIELLFSSAIK